MNSFFLIFFSVEFLRDYVSKRKLRLITFLDTVFTLKKNSPLVTDTAIQ